MLKTVVIIPARMNAHRLPGKPLLDIGGRPMIQHVYERAVAANLGPVIVATPDPEIQTHVQKAGGTAVETSPTCPSGTDRVAEAFFNKENHSDIDVVINLQGDLPFLEPSLLTNLLRPFSEDEHVQMATLACPLEASKKNNPHIVKALWKEEPQTSWGIAQDFCRNWPQAPSPQLKVMHHIGIYAFRPACLKRYTELPEGKRERAEKLEQLRAFDHNIAIAVQPVTDEAPLSVDTPQDLLAAQRCITPSLNATAS